MGETVVTTTQVAPALSTFYDRNLLVNARALLVHDKFGQTRKLPERSGQSIKFRRANILPVATTPLVEGVTPSGSTFSYSEVTATPKQYGDYVYTSDVVSLVNQDKVITDITTEQGYQAGMTVDTLRRDVLVAGTNVQYANGTARTDVNTLMAAGDIDTVVRLLENNNALRFTQLVKAGSGVDTSPVEPSFWGVCHPDIVPTIKGFTNFTAVKNYASQADVQPGEFGEVGGVRWIKTTQGKVWLGGGATSGTNVKETSSHADVYASLVFAQNAYGIIPLGPGAIQSIVKGLGSAGASDPLNQRASVGWKTFTTTKILNDAFMVRIESAAKSDLTV